MVAGGWWLVIGGWRLEAESWRLGVGGLLLEGWMVGWLGDWKAE